MDQHSQEYVPLFEKIFTLNAFPSQADKNLLARKSGMTYKQIDVWVRNPVSLLTFHLSNSSSKIAVVERRRMATS